MEEHPLSCEKTSQLGKMLSISQKPLHEVHELGDISSCH